MWHYLRDPTFGRFHAIPECDRHTETDRQTDGQLQAVTALRRVVKIDHIAPHTKPNYQATSVDSKFYVDQEMSVISTYLNDNAQTPLNGFIVYMLYKQICNKYGEQSNRWSLSLSVCAAPPSTVGSVILNSRRRDTVDSKSPSAVEILF